MKKDTFFDPEGIKYSWISSYLEFDSSIEVVRIYIFDKLCIIKLEQKNRVNYVMWFILQERWYCILWLSDVELSLQQGVYLYLGYSQKDEALLKKVTKQGALEAIGAIQSLVNYKNVNSNKVTYWP